MYCNTCLLHIGIYVSFEDPDYLAPNIGIEVTTEASIYTITTRKEGSFYVDQIELDRIGTLCLMLDFHKTHPF